MALLKLVHQGAATEKKLMQEFWKHHTAYGYGDSQLAHMLQHLQPLFIRQGEITTLNESGELVLKGEKSYTTASEWLGGVFIAANRGYCFNAESQQLENF